MLKKRVLAVLTGLALIAAVAGASVGVANRLVAADAPLGQAIACDNGGTSGGGC